MPNDQHVAPSLLSLQDVVAEFRKLAQRFEQYAARASQPDHLTTHLMECGVQAGRLMVHAIDGGAFRKEQKSLNRGWWNRSIARLPGGPMTVYGALPAWLMKSARIEHPGLQHPVTIHGAPTPDASERANRDAAGVFNSQQFRLCWINTVAWLAKEFPERFRDRASSRDWWTVATDAKGQYLGKDGKPIRGHWYKEGERLADDFRPTVEILDGEYEWRLDGPLAGTTDNYTDTDLLEHQRIRTDVYADACNLLAELIEQSMTPPYGAALDALVETKLREQAEREAAKPLAQKLHEARDHVDLIIGLLQGMQKSNSQLRPGALEEAADKWRRWARHLHEEGAGVLPPLLPQPREWLADLRTTREWLDGALAALTSSSAPTLPGAAKPQYDQQRRILSFGGQVVKHFRQRAQHQEKVILVFEEEGWPPRIDDPLPRGRRNDAIRCLNRHMKASLIRFIADGTGEGIGWEQIPQRVPGASVEHPKTARNTLRP